MIELILIIYGLVIFEMLRRVNLLIKAFVGQVKFNADTNKLFESLVDKVENTIKLKPNEHIKIMNLKFGEGVNIYKDDGEPIDSLTILTYSNIKEGEHV